MRYFDMSVLGKFSVVMADPPWDIHMEVRSFLSPFDSPVLLVTLSSVYKGKLIDDHFESCC